MNRLIDITAVLNMHDEGVVAGPSLVSFDQTIETARHAGLAVEGLIVLDRANKETRQQVAGSSHKIIETDFGDPGLARNAAVLQAKGYFVGFLDGDDLWYRNWLLLAHRFCSAKPEMTIAHSEYNVIFGMQRHLAAHVDSLSPKFYHDFLRYNNYWDSLSFAMRNIYIQYPFAFTDRNHGFGHEDWHWNCLTLSVGIDHRPVPGTVHFKRRRRTGSNLNQNNAVNAIPWMTSMASFEWKMSPL